MVRMRIILLSEKTTPKCHRPSEEMSSNGASGSSQGGSKGGKKSDRDLDLENSHRGVWLVKVPKYISDRWEKAAANTEVRHFYHNIHSCILFLSRRY